MGVHVLGGWFSMVHLGGGGALAALRHDMASHFTSFSKGEKLCISLFPPFFDICNNSKKKRKEKKGRHIDRK